ncbi:MAG TPA: hypothetical protein VK463_10745 [Desulfomonilaceae bacterium]|nr:hypothetical protein [Desulfomonilaceae bacterium]
MIPVSWNSHALLTASALENYASASLLQPVPVVGLEEFLSRAQASVAALLGDHVPRVAVKIDKPGQPREWHGTILKPADFVRAVRLNPEIVLQYVRLRRPEEVDAKAPHDTSREGPPGPMYVPVGEDEHLQPLEIIVTYSDEPDWGMDQDLFTVEEYQYGSCPYGAVSGKSSQAPFHMAFLNESPVLTALLPRLRVSFMEERIRIFVGLAKCAFQADVGYWGCRFLAWALHYLQDLTQPYHASPFPVPLLPLVKRFMRRPRWKGFLESNKHYLKNRHLLFEALVHFLLNDAVKKCQRHAFLDALRGAGHAATGTLRGVMRRSSHMVSSMARKTDRCLADLVQAEKLLDPDYILEHDEDFCPDVLVSAAARLRPGAHDRFVDAVSACLAETGKVTRYVLDTHFQSVVLR